MVSTPAPDAAASTATPPPHADAPPSPSRPLLVAWPQVKAFVSLAQEALRAKAVAHEVKRWRDEGWGWEPRPATRKGGMRGFF